MYFVPAFAGLFAPYWRSDARGVITGLTAFNTKVSDLFNNISLRYCLFSRSSFTHFLLHYLIIASYSSLSFPFLQAHIVRAALEASAFQTVDVSNAMQLDAAHRLPLTTLRVDGGMTANSLLMQFLSDLLDVPLVR